MAKDKTIYTCNDCGGTSPKWLGKCPHCNAWNTLVESIAESNAPVKNRYSSQFQLTGPLAQFGRMGIVKEIASGITAQFAAKLKQQLVPALPGLAGSPAPAPAQSAAASLNIAALVWQLIKLRVQRWNQSMN